MPNLSEQQIIRRKKLNQLRLLGINPYPTEEYCITNTIVDIQKNFIEKETISIAGRLIRLRILGKASFGEIKDHTGRIQIYFNKNHFYSEKMGKEDSYNILLKKLIDIGDIIGVKGFLFKTKMDEITIHVHRLTLLSKSLRPLPQVKVDKNKKIYDAFSNTEQRYRMRYVDLIVNDHVKEIFLKRTRIIREIRNFLDHKGYLEVDTPILQSIPGGAIARPFITYHNSLGIPLYLRIANELYLKRLIIGGFHGVYEFSKNFRNEGMDRLHNPEFTVLELYVAYKDYYWMMKFTEELMKCIYKKVQNEYNIEKKNNWISFQTPFPRIPIFEAIKKNTGLDIKDMEEEGLRKICKKLHIVENRKMNKSKMIENIFEEKCKKHYKNPTFIIDYPVEMSPLTKRHRHKKNLSERFELIINGQEIANAYSELNDPIDQLDRFRKQISEKNTDESMFIDQDFIRALEFGMPPTAGIGIGIDRLVMLLTQKNSIQEVLFFPQMRPENRE
ncbi:MAG: lysine--tRNA ligase [Flavobacteriales bacterium]|jgi:lysyl-tRNA synthetase class 2|uniref:lysine--tRNA ligase n=1 Tax=Blattabacterium sp. (Mastotermes darwiniensis) TaxID=39768 RepID=UPI000231DF7F|nr:lysine--tRNA ligase [Blattabacterium sp. (Mastotermes darwiniensis)]AER40407.1 lysine-tRNA ligase [Blattabacterium sp. (Mastotermes darwiniensis) str. MADAR]MDR1804872.1 lysine--tRNA ligase [Flavobacteriales bacterium]